MECFSADDDQFNQYEDFSVIHATVTIRTSDVLSCPPGRRGKTKKLEESDFFIIVFPNGTSGNPGCVSLILLNWKPNIYFDGICIVSLIDSSNCHRFSQTFTIPYPQVTVFTIEEIISRKMLLSDPDDLLPDGELTLMIHVRLTLYPVICDNKTDSYFNFRFYMPGQKDLPLNSCLTRKLSEDSTYFRAISDTPMRESRRNKMAIQAEEEVVFRTVHALIIRTNAVRFYSIKEIFDLYILADKYHFTLVIDTCTCFWKLYTFAHNTDKLFECINEYEDECVKELLENQIMLLRHTNFAEEIVKTDERVTLKQPVHNYLWTYVYCYKERYLQFVNINKSTKHILSKKENDEYDFYK